MRAPPVTLLAVCLAVAGCGARTASMRTNESGSVRIVRPAKPVWCPEKLPSDARMQAERFDARALLGLMRNRAGAKAAQHGCSSRVVKIDGRALIITSDLDTRRVDLTLEHHVVTAVDIG